MKWSQYFSFFTKADLHALLEKCNHNPIHSRWKKEQYIKHLEAYKIEQVLDICTVEQLKNILKRLELPVSGTKTVIVKRLVEAFAVVPTKQQNHQQSKKMTTIPVFFSKEQSVKNNDCYSPSAQKPGLLIRDWKKKSFPITIHESKPITVQDFYLAHKTEFVDNILSCSIPNGFGNTSKNIAKTLPYTTGSFFSAALHVLEHGGVAISPTSGFHHATYNEAEDYCTFNGLMVTAIKLHQEYKVGHIGILDLDQHFGNGTQDIIDVHKIDYITHYTYGKHVRGYESQDHFLEDLLLQLQQMKDDGVEIILAQFGADPHKNDPLARTPVQLSSATMKKRDAMALQFCKDHCIPLVWNLAGGYQKPISKVLDIHTTSLEETIRIYLEAD